MKILHFITTIDKSSGGITAYLQLLSPLLSAQVECVVVAGHSQQPVNIEGTRIIFSNMRVARFLSLKHEFRQILLDEKPDIVHINGIWEPQTWWFQQEAQRCHIPVLLSPHGMMEPWILNHNRLKKKIALFLYQHKAIRLATSLHATAAEEAGNLQKLGYTQPIHIIPNGIDLTQIQLKKDWQQKRKILFLSRIHPKKGIQFLIEAVAELRESLLDWEVVVAGEGETEYREKLEKEARKRGVSTIVRFTGGVYQAQKWQLFAEADLFVLPTHSENFGIVVAEALACGTPVITTKGTPWSELESHKCGWWTEIGTQPLIKALSDFLSKTPSELEEMGRNGAQLIQNNYSAANMAQSFLNIYKDLNQSK